MSGEAPVAKPWLMNSGTVRSVGWRSHVVVVESSGNYSDFPKSMKKYALDPVSSPPANIMLLTEVSLGMRWSV